MECVSVDNKLLIMESRIKIKLNNNASAATKQEVAVNKSE